MNLILNFLNSFPKYQGKNLPQNLFPLI